VAVDTIKLSPVLGIGTANYLTAFNKFLPVPFNESQLWGARFSTSRTFVLTLATENGLFGIISFGLVIFLIIKESLTTFKHALKHFGEKETSLLSLFILSIFFFSFPANIPLIMLFFILISLVFANQEFTINLTHRASAFVVSLILVIGVGFLTFFGYKYLKAERIYKIAVMSLANNDGKATYDALKTTININPYVDRYHSTYAQVNLALARSLGQKKELTDQDRATIAQLIQQGIREAKATVTLNPQRAGNWEVLAGTYRSVFPFAQGADQFAIQSYKQASSLDPINPNLRIALGGVYYALGRYDEAISTFKLAVLAKKDLANAHYNLAIAYREKKDLDNAISEMQTVIRLVDKNSEDYGLAVKALDELQKNKTAPKTTGSTDNLNTPQKNEGSKIKPAITLPTDSNPPATGE
jgi:tetratricopeptide (TPR) repeat protein